MNASQRSSSFMCCFFRAKACFVCSHHPLDHHGQVLHSFTPFTRMSSLGCAAMDKKDSKQLQHMTRLLNLGWVSAVSWKRVGQSQDELCFVYDSCNPNARELVMSDSCLTKEPSSGHVICLSLGSTHEGNNCEAAPLGKRTPANLKDHEIRTPTATQNVN